MPRISWVQFSRQSTLQTWLLPYTRTVLGHFNILLYFNCQVAEQRNMSLEFHLLILLFHMCASERDYFRHIFPSAYVAPVTIPGFLDISLIISYQCLFLCHRVAKLHGIVSTCMSTLSLQSLYWISRHFYTFQCSVTTSTPFHKPSVIRASLGIKTGKLWQVPSFMCISHPSPHLAIWCFMTSCRVTLVSVLDENLKNT